MDEKNLKNEKAIVSEPENKDNPAQNDKKEQVSNKNENIVPEYKIDKNEIQQDNSEKTSQSDAENDGKIEVIENNNVPNAQKNKSTLKKVASILTSVFIVVFTAFLVMMVITSKVYFSAKVVGKSMDPTINATVIEEEYGDYAFYTLYKEANINDIIIVDYDNSNISDNIDAIKRLIAVGGDTICFYGGKILRNGKPIDDWYMQKAIERKNQLGEDGNAWATSGYSKCRSEFISFCSNLLYNTATYHTHEYYPEKDTTFVKLCKVDSDFRNKHIKKDAALNTFVLTVPEDYIFFLGDNRADSLDCSDVGPIEKKYLLAKVDFLLEYDYNVFQKIYEQFVHIFA